MARKKPSSGKVLATYALFNAIQRALIKSGVPEEIDRDTFRRLLDVIENKVRWHRARGAEQGAKAGGGDKVRVYGRCS